MLSELNIFAISKIVIQSAIKTSDGSEDRAKYLNLVQKQDVNIYVDVGN